MVLPDHTVVRYVEHCDCPDDDDIAYVWTKVDGEWYEAEESIPDYRSDDNLFRAYPTARIVSLPTSSPITRDEWQREIEATVEFDAAYVAALHHAHD